MDKNGLLDNDIPREETQLGKRATEGRRDNPKRRAFSGDLPNFSIQARSVITSDVSLLQHFNRTPDTRGV